MSDEMNVEILEDGTIKVETSAISQQNHMTAEALLRNLATAGGAKQTRKHKHGIIGAAIHAAQHALNKPHSH